jgi:hypothetical protein
MRCMAQRDEETRMAANLVRVAADLKDHVGVHTHMLRRAIADID